MRAAHARGLFILCVFVAASAIAASNAEVVTGGHTLSASMTLTTDANGCPTWQVTGKVNPEMRGHGARVALVCMSSSCLDPSALCHLRTFGTPSNCNEDFCQQSNVDACGNFAFEIPVCDGPVQLDPSNTCVFVAHVDDGSLPQACSGSGQVPAQSADPGGSSPCTGAFCPSSRQ